MDAVDVALRLCITLVYLLTFACRGRADLAFEDYIDGCLRCALDDICRQVSVRGGSGFRWEGNNPPHAVFGLSFIPYSDALVAA